MTSTPASPALAPQLEDLIVQLDDCSRRARELVDGLSPAQLAARPAPESWSVAECIEHLTLTNRPFPALLRGVYDEARRGGLVGDGPFKTDLMGRLLVWTIEPPARLKVKARAPFQPVDVGDPGRVLPAFLELQEEIKACVREAAGLRLDKVKIPSPVDARVKYNAYAGLRIIAAHERRHLWQASRARERVLATETRRQ